MFEQYRTYNAWTHAETGERVYHVKDYPEIGDAFDCHPRGSVPDYCWGDYVITENRVLLSAYCYIKADGHLIYGNYTLFVLAPSRQWYLRATGLASGTSLPRNYWLGSTLPFVQKFTKVPTTIIYPSKVRELLAPLEKCDGPARLAAEYVLADLDTWPYEVVYALENNRHRAQVSAEHSIRD